MLGLLGAKCPLPACDKLWIEQRMCWLAEVFGIERLRRAPEVVPTADWFPNRYTGAPEDIVSQAKRVLAEAPPEPAIP